MNEALHHIRKKYYALLNDTITVNGSTVPAYNRVPTSASEPYIKISSVSTNEVDQNADSFNVECVTRIEVVTGFDGDSGGDLDANKIVDGVLNKIRKRSADYIDLLSDNFNVYTTTIEGVQYIEEDMDDKSYFRSIIEVSNRLEKI